MVYLFEKFRLDPAEHRLLHDGVGVPLTPKAFDTLVVLVRRAGQLVSKEELLQEVWPQTFVEDIGLTRNISSLRKALGERAADQPFIETVPKRGYRFIADVREVESGADEGARPLQSRAGGSEPPHPPPMVVVAPRRAMWIVAGSAAVVTLLIVALFSRTAARVERAESRTTPAERRAKNPAAYDAYLNGRRAWNRRTPESIAQARVLFNQALDLDATYAPGYAGLADAYVLLGAFGSLKPDEAFPRARAAALRAIDLDETIAEAHTSLAFERFAYEWDWPGAEREYKRAIELNPNYATANQWYAILLMVLGRADESIAMIRHSEQLDPLSRPIASDIGELLCMARRYDDVLDHVRRMRRVSPEFPVENLAGHAYLGKSMYPEAIAAYERAHRPGTNPWPLAAAYAQAGDGAKARTLMQPFAESWDEASGSFEWAVVHTALGEHDQALAALERAYQGRLITITWLKVSPSFDPLRSDPGFQDLLRRLHLG